MATKSYGAEMAQEGDLTARDFPLTRLPQHATMTAMAKALGMIQQAIRLPCARSNVVEVKM